MEAIRSHFFNGRDFKEKKYSWARWDYVLASKHKGGLGVSSFFALNCALMFKWIWRFKTQDSMWARFIKAIYGDHGHIDHLPKSTRSSAWMDIVREVHRLKLQGIDLMAYCVKKVGNGVHTMFWSDPWLGDVPLKIQYPRLYALETVKGISVAEKIGHHNISHSFSRLPIEGIAGAQCEVLGSRLSDIVLPQIEDRWFWLLMGNGEFTVASVRKLLDGKKLPTVSEPTRWVKSIPIKINVFAWKVSLDKLPTRFNLSIRGVDMNCILCPICGVQAETTDHLFFSCSLASALLHKVIQWWSIGFPYVSNYKDCLSWFKGLRYDDKAKQVLEGIFYVMWWKIWRFQNEIIFDSKQPKKAILFDDLVTLSYNWCNSRGRSNINWVGWLKNPMLALL